jgi:hypothetical protein
MTERDLGNSLSWWIGEVVNVYDPDQSGRVQVRVYGRHDDVSNVPDDALPWALPLQPVTSAAYGKLGTAPLGLVRGSKIMGFWMDQDQQYPVIWGSFGKAGDPVPGQTQDGTEKIDIKTGSIPSPAINQSDPVAMNPFSKLYPDRVDITKINDPRGQDFKKLNQFTPSIGVINNEKVDTKLKEPTKPTTASVDKNDKSDVIDHIIKSDPDKLSRALPNLVDSYKGVRDIMSVTSPAGLTNLLAGGIQGVIGKLAGSLGIGGALGLMAGLSASGVLSGVAGNALKLATANFALDVAANNGLLPPMNIVSTTIPKVNPLIGHPQQSYVVTTPPPTYVQQYYELDQEPYPGYIVYMDPKTSQKVYRPRGNEPHYSSMQSHIQGNAAVSMQSQIGRIVAGAEVANLLGNSALGNLAGGITAVALPAGAAKALGAVISSGLGGVAAQGIASVLGNGVNLSNITLLAGKLIPNISGNIDGMMSGHSPQSVLGSGVGQAMGNFTQDQALLAMKKDKMKSGLEPDIDSKLADANKRLAASENAKNITGTSEIINGQKVTYTATGATVSKV